MFSNSFHLIKSQNRDGKWVINGIVPWPRRCVSSSRTVNISRLKILLYDCLNTRTPSCMDHKIMINISEHGNFSTSGQFSLGEWSNTNFLYSFFLSMFFLLLPQHLATLLSSLRFTKCRRFILQQNFFYAALLLVIFVLALLFTHFWLLFWCKSKGANGIFFTWLWVLWTSLSVDFPLQQLLPWAWTGFSRCYWDWDTDTQ